MYIVTIYVQIRTQTLLSKCAAKCMFVNRNTEVSSNNLEICLYLCYNNFTSLNCAFS